MAKQFDKGPKPSIYNWRAELKKYKGLFYVFSKQCPWVARFIEEVKPVLDEYKIEPKVIELMTPVQAQKAPSLYAVFTLIYNGKILADRYISTTRFKNIITREIS